MKVILVPTDFSKSADNACRYAIEIAKHTKAKIILMHAYETPLVYTEIPALTIQLNNSELYNAALSQLKKYYNKINRILKGVSFELILQQGLASSRIVEVATEKKVDLIVMGTTGKGAVERIVMGSNAARVIREAPCMVMAIPPKAKFEGLKKVVYTTDLLNDNLEHTKALIPFAKIFNSELLFLHINTKIFTGSEDDDLKSATKKIKAHIKYPKMSGFICNDTNVASGINYFLKKHKADCVVMFTHARNIIQRVFSQSNTKEVAFTTSVPLLVIHENDLDIWS